MGQEESGVYAVVLGNVQDAGVPHAGCCCPRCATAFADSRMAEWAACLALVDSRPRSAQVWLFDVTPDVKYQLHWLYPQLGKLPGRPDRLRPPDGVFLTHGHMGHTGGLVHFGPEAMAVVDMPLYAPAGLIEVLRQTQLWQPMLSSFNLRPLVAGQSVLLAPELTVTPISVPHRDEWTAGTFAYRIQGPRRTLLYLPDIDSWQEWPEARTILAGVDIALVDASFYAADELAGRVPVAHPLVPDTLRFLADLPLELVLTHLNHTNPALDVGSRERAEVLAAGATIAFTGMTFGLS